MVLLHTIMIIGLERPSVTAVQPLCPLCRGLDARRAAWGLLQNSNCIVF